MKHRRQFALLIFPIFACASADAEVDSADIERRKIAVLGPIEPGDQKSLQYTATPPYRAYSFSGDAGDIVDVWVRSGTNDAIAYILDANFSTIAQNDDDGPGTRDAHIRFTLTKAGRHYLALRDARSRPGGFIVSFDRISITRSTQFVALASGAGYSCGLGRDGTVWCWGSNNYGQLGRRSTYASERALKRVEGVTDAVSITAGHSHACALRRDATAVCWGHNKSGQLGRGGAGPDQVEAAPVVGLSGIKTLSAGRSHTCATFVDGDYACWGSNEQGQLGFLRATEDPRIPVKRTAEIPNVPMPIRLSFSNISAGEYTTCAHDRDQSTYCWGNQAFGALGAGREAWGIRTVPKSTTRGNAGGAGASLSVGSLSACETTVDGSGWCWGENRNGKLGVTSPWSSSSTAMRLSGLQDLQGVAMSAFHGCAVSRANELFCWGAGQGFQVGPERISRQDPPKKVPDFSNAKAVSVGYGFSCALKSDGAIWCWGQNDESQLGAGPEVRESAKPLQVLVP